MVVWKGVNVTVALNLTVNSFPKKPLLCMCLYYKSYANTVGKREIARNEQFLLFPMCFLPFCTLCHFHQNLKIKMYINCLRLEDPGIYSLGKG